MDESTKTAAVRLDIKNYRYLKDVGKINNRSISGQANWVCRVVEILQDSYPEIYAEISHKLNKDGY